MSQPQNKQPQVSPDGFREGARRPRNRARAILGGIWRNLRAMTPSPNDRCEATRRTRNRACSILRSAWGNLCKYQRKYERVEGNELIVFGSMPDALRSLQPLGLAVLRFIRTMVGREGVEPVDARLFLSENGEIEHVVFGDEDAPSALERAERAEYLARVYCALVQSAIATDRTNFWRAMGGSRNWQVLGHQALAYAQEIESYSWLIKLICHRPDRRLDDETIADITNLRQLGSTAQAYAVCLEEQMRLLPSHKLKWPVLTPERYPRSRKSRVVVAELPTYDNNSDDSPDEIRSALLLEMFSDAREGHRYGYGGSGRICCLRAKVRLVGFCASGGRRGNHP